MPIDLTLLSNKYVQSAIIFLAAVIGCKIIYFIFEKVLMRLAAKTKTTVDDKIVEGIESSVTWVFFLSVLKYAVLPLKFVPQVENIIILGIYSLICLFVTLAIIIVADILITSWGKTWAARTKSKVDDQLVALLHKFSKVILAILGTLYVLDMWGIQVMPLIASLGIAGIAVALALQNTLGNIFGGISMIIDKTIKVGDVVEIDAATKGTILDVGLRSTRIRTFDNEVIIMPNGKLADTKIINYVLPDMSVRAVVPFSVAYGSDIDQVKNLIVEVVKTVDNYKEEPAPVVRFTEMDNSSLNFKAYFYVDDYSKRFASIDQANTAIYNALNKAGINIPFPQMDVHMKNE